MFEWEKKNWMSPHIRNVHSKASENMYIDVDFIVCKALDTVLFNHSTPQGWRNSGCKLLLFTSQMAKYVWPDCYFALDHILYGFLLFIVLMVVWLMNSSWMVFVRHLFLFFFSCIQSFQMLLLRILFGCHLMWLKQTFFALISQ